MSTPLSCGVCGSKQLTDFGPLTFHNSGYAKKSQLLQCLECGFAWISPFPDEAKMARVYAQSYHYQPNPLKDAIFGFYLQQFLVNDYQRIIKYKKSGQVLDIGAGRGDLLNLFDDKWVKWAHDPNISTSDITRLEAKIGPHVNQFPQLTQYPKGQFDLIILRNVIEHTVFYQDLIKQASRLLKPNGLIFIRTPNSNSADFKLFNRRWGVVNMEGHMSFFNLRSISKLLSASRLTIRYQAADKRSTILSFFRNLQPVDKNSGMRLIKSLLYYWLSPSLGEGGDIIIIAQKKLT